MMGLKACVAHDPSQETEQCSFLPDHPLSIYSEATSSTGCMIHQSEMKDIL